MAGNRRHKSNTYDPMLGKVRKEDVSEQQLKNIKAGLEHKADINHTHDDRYAPLGHAHTGTYASANHNHDDRYANINHHHNSAYAALNHNHDSAYAAQNHNHDGEYQPLGSYVPTARTINGHPLSANIQVTTNDVAPVQTDHGTNNTTFTLTPNVLHTWGTVTSLTLSFGTPVSGIVNEYMIQFTAGTNFALSLPNGIKWSKSPMFTQGNSYHISIVNNLAFLTEFYADINNAGSSAALPNMTEEEILTILNQDDEEEE